MQSLIRIKLWSQAQPMQSLIWFKSKIRRKYHKEHALLNNMDTQAPSTPQQKTMLVPPNAPHSLQGEIEQELEESPAKRQRMSPSE